MSMTRAQLAEKIQTPRKKFGYDEIIRKFADARRIVFFTGAGISAESGIATFRGTDGIWQKFSPQELANFDAFMRNPDLVWEWYQYRRSIVHEAMPNSAHYAITEMQSIFDSVIVVTQNVDNLHRRAGNNHIYELHGNIEKNYCIKCKKRYDYVDFSGSRSAPVCDCGGRVRPDIVWFGESLPMDQYSASEEAAADCDVLFSIGTSAVVYPAANIPFIARRNRKFVIEINIDPTDSDCFDVVIPEKAGLVLPLIMDEIKELRK